MYKRILPAIVLGILMIGVTISGCKKSSTIGIDNDQVIKIPYSLYAGDIDGAIMTTTNGIQFKDVFPPDGYRITTMVTAGENLLVVKKNLHLSKNGSHNFNPVFRNLNIFPWQTMLYEYPNHGRVFVTADKGKGVYYSEDKGLSWQEDTLWIEENKLPPNYEVSSFSGLANGHLFSYSNVGNVLFVRDDTFARWSVVETKGAFPVGTESEYYLTSNNNTLFLIDYNGIGGAWYSEDEGTHWTKVQRGEMPASGTVKFLTAISPTPEGASLLVGTDSAGVYENIGGYFVQASVGLESQEVSYSFALKSNKYKNDAVKKYVYLGTSVGLYRSENLGKTWYPVTTGARNQMYTSIY